MVNRVTEYLFTASALLLAGCSEPYSILAPAGPSAKAVTTIWWGMLTVGVVVLLGICSLWWYASFRRNRKYSDADVKRVLTRMVLWGGIVLPTVGITVLLIFGIPAGNIMLPLVDERAVRIDVHARQWAWDVTYPQHDIELTDEIHIPVDTPIDIHVTSADVIHGFWVPRLGGKIDAIPGHTNIVRLQADEVGEFGGQCAEYCGLSHAKMHFKVIAHSAEKFDAWLVQQGKTQ
ncbi:Cytochrome c oxidase polypeptide II [Alteromonas macleodii]